MINNRYTLFVFILLLILFFNCARVIAPSGGPKDKTPPEVVETQPANYSTLFQKKKFSVTFDEYIQLKSVNQQLVISPPIIDEPEIKLSGKTILIKFTEDLPDSTTINFNFRDAIADYNEGNILENYQYVFSTDSIIDTLFVKGLVINAFDHKAVSDMMVMLYANIADSSPKTIRPSYICKSNIGGEFEFRNIHEGKYKVFALSDANYNMLFDLPTENIAFLDTLIKPAVELLIITDTITEDSIVTISQTVSKLDTLRLYVFEESNPIQYLEDSKREEEGKKCVFYFSESLSKPLQIDLIDTAVSNWFILEENPGMDTITYWIKDSVLLAKDTLTFQLSYLKTDSLGELIQTKDTIKLISEKKEKIKQQKRNLLRRNKEDSDTIKRSDLKLKTNIIKYTLGLKSDLLITANYPVLSVDKNKIYLYELEDTIEKPLKFKLVEDTIKPRTYRIKYPFEESLFYKLLIDTAAFEDIYGNENDTLFVKYIVQKESYYGSIELTILGVEKTSIFQLINEKDKVAREYSVDENNNIIDIELLSPGKYRFKLFSDDNKNGKWDTGDYSEKKQPEKVFFYNKTVTIKSGWDNEIKWNINTVPEQVFVDAKKTKKRGR
ncbi:MAG: Ig-like domain-containing protein [Chlorobi bacterium]|nr:Ig-like domain-containing protein [Chlorobiota bacterium]